MHVLKLNYFSGSMTINIRHKRITYCICSIRRCDYYLFRHAILCSYYSRAAFIKLRGIATATDTEIKKPDPFTDIDEDKNELEENEVVLEDC